MAKKPSLLRIDIYIYIYISLSLYIYIYICIYIYIYKESGSLKRAVFFDYGFSQLQGILRSCTDHIEAYRECYW